MEDKGLKDNDSMTPREFRRIAGNRLKIAESTIYNMTKLFEEARYSVHELGGEDRERALKDLKALKAVVECENDENRRR